MLVVREGMEAEVRDAVGDRIARHVPVAYAVQGGALPPGFAPPPGRTQAVGHRPRHPRGRAAPRRPLRRDQRRRLLRRRQLPGAGRAPATAADGPVPEFAIVGFPLVTTLSPDGPVSRGVCTVDEKGFLVSIREVLKVERDGEDARGARRRRARGSRSPARRPSRSTSGASRPPSCPALEDGFRRFLEQNARAA